jgi:diacylglycerol kinase
MTVRKINRLKSFQYAFSGIWYTVKTQRNAQIHLTIAVVIFVLGLALKLNSTEWAILALTTGFVISVEMLNTVAEAAMDYATSEFNPQVKIVKDVAAGAVLVAAITAVLVGLLILGPPLFQRLTSLFPTIRLSNYPL